MRSDPVAVPPLPPGVATAEPRTGFQTFYLRPMASGRCAGRICFASVGLCFCSPARGRASIMFLMAMAKIFNVTTGPVRLRLRLALQAERKSVDSGDRGIISVQADDGSRPAVIREVPG